MATSKPISKSTPAPEPIAPPRRPPITPWSDAENQKFATLWVADERAGTMPASDQSRWKRLIDQMPEGRRRSWVGGGGLAIRVPRLLAAIEVERAIVEPPKVVKSVFAGTRDRKDGLPRVRWNQAERTNFADRFALLELADDTKKLTIAELSTMVQDELVEQEKLLPNRRRHLRTIGAASEHFLYADLVKARELAAESLRMHELAKEAEQAERDAEAVEREKQEAEDRKRELAQPYVDEVKVAYDKRLSELETLALEQMEQIEQLKRQPAPGFASGAVDTISSMGFIKLAFTTLFAEVLESPRAMAAIRTALAPAGGSPVMFSRTAPVPQPAIAAPAPVAPKVEDELDEVGPPPGPDAWKNADPTRTNVVKLKTQEGILPAAVPVAPKKRICIIGMHPASELVIKNEFEGSFRLSFIGMGQGSPKQTIDSAKSADSVYAASSLPEAVRGKLKRSVKDYHVWDGRPAPLQRLLQAMVKVA